jgi:VWFA-related protein
MPFLVVFLAVFFNQSPPQEVRIHSGVYTPQPLTLGVQTNLVELAATVRDNHGKFASGLQASDFEVLDKGVPQTINVFVEQDAPAAPGAPANAAPAVAAPVNAPQPRSIALFFDDTHTENAGLQKAKEAAEKLITTGLQPDDRMGIFTDSGKVTQDFTNDAKVLLEAVARVQPHPHIGLRGMGNAPTLTPYEAFVIAKHLDFVIRDLKVQEVCSYLPGFCDRNGLERARQHVQDVAEAMWNQFQPNSSIVLDVLEVVLRRLASMPGNRILVLVSPGFPTTGLENRKDSIIEAALRAHIVINSLNAEALVAGMKAKAIGLRQELLSELMSDVAAGTGGRYIQNSNDFEGAIRTLSAPPEVSYLIGFSPAKEPDGKYHELKVRLKNHSGFQVDSRPGYYATAAPKLPDTVQQRIDREASSAETLAEMPATVRVSSVNAEAGLITIDVNIKVDANHLKFMTQDDRRVQQLTFVTLLQDERGHVITGKEAVMDLSLLPATLADMQAKGIKAGITLTVPKGSYQVREIIREAVENHMAISNTPVEAP